MADAINFELVEKGYHAAETEAGKAELFREGKSWRVCLDGNILGEVPTLKIAKETAAIAVREVARDRARKATAHSGKAPAAVAEPEAAPETQVYQETAPAAEAPDMTVDGINWTAAARKQLAMLAAGEALTRKMPVPVQRFEEPGDAVIESAAKKLAERRCEICDESLENADRSSPKGAILTVLGGASSARAEAARCSRTRSRAGWGR